MPSPLVVAACLASALEPASPLEPKSSLDPAVIRRVLKQHTPAIRTCYDQALARNPALSGRMSLRWTVETDGTVSKAEVQSLPAEDAEFGKCLVGVLRGMQFPRLAGGQVTITYPFVLSNQPEPPAATSG